MNRPTVVYIACPMRQGHWTDNMRLALDTATRLRVKGYSPIVPSLSWFWDLVYPTKFDDWFRMDCGLILVSDCLLRLRGKSEGADLEMDFAIRNDIPVFACEYELYEEMPPEILRTINA